METEQILKQFKERGRFKTVKEVNDFFEKALKERDKEIERLSK